MHYFITGGAGFIGSNYLDQLLNGNYGHYDSVTVYDSLNYASNLKNLQRHFENPRFSFIEGDICDRNLVESKVKYNSYMLHFAAETHVDRSLKDPNKFVQTNVVGTQILLEVALKICSPRFVYVSTDEVYGPKIEGTSSELDLLNPTSPYAASKAAAEMLVNCYHKNFGLDVAVTRSCNNFGPNQDNEKLIPKIIEKILKDDFIPLYGNGKNIREWIYVEDNCNAINLVLQLGKSGETYNIGTGELLTNLDIAKQLLDFFHKPQSLIRFVPDRIAHDYRYAVNSTKIKSELGFKAHFSLKNALANYALGINSASSDL